MKGRAKRVSGPGTSVSENVAMAKSLLFRLFGLGKMPEAVLAEIADETQLLFTQGVRVSLRRRGHVPGSVVAGRAVNVGWGAFAITNRRVVGTRSRAKWV